MSLIRLADVIHLMSCICLNVLEVVTVSLPANCCSITVSA